MEPTIEFSSTQISSAAAGQPVAARGGHVLDEGIDLHVLFLGQPADARGDERGLRRAIRRGN